jgi:hypothetical protein
VHRRYVLTALAVVAAGTVAMPAHAASKPKPFSKTVTFTDATPDPTGGAISADADPTMQICDGKLPREAGVKVTVPGPGKLKLAISDIQGDWALSLRDSKGTFVNGDDVNPDPTASTPPAESVTQKIKKAGTYLILPCNLGGTTTATLKYSYTPA